MNGKQQETPKKLAFSDLRKVSLVLAAVLVFFLSYYVYVEFGVGDVWYWLREVFLLLFVLLLVILAAAVTVWLMMLIRRKLGKF